MEIKVNHVEMTDEESYNNIKELNKMYPELFMDAEEWKALRMRTLKAEGKNWSY